MENMELWDEFKETPPSVTKKFTRGGGFSGKAIDPMYVIERLTKQFGPVGTGWGWEITGEDYVIGAPFKSDKHEGNTIIHKIRLRLWYMDYESGDKCFTGEQFGLTTFVGEYSSGPFTDEEHAKKSVTDAVGKCAVQLGVAADVHMGRHDDSKYVNDLNEKLKEESGKTPDKKTTTKTKTNGGGSKVDIAKREAISKLAKEKGKGPIDLNKWLYAEFNLETLDQVNSDNFTTVQKALQAMDKFESVGQEIIDEQSSVPF